METPGFAALTTQHLERGLCECSLQPAARSIRTKRALRRHQWETLTQLSRMQYKFHLPLFLLLLCLCCFPRLPLSSLFLFSLFLLHLLLPLFRLLPPRLVLSCHVKLITLGSALRTVSCCRSGPRYVQHFGLTKIELSVVVPCVFEGLGWPKALCLAWRDTCGGNDHGKYSDN